MPFVGTSTAVGANSEVDLLAGTQYEFTGGSRQYNVAAICYSAAVATATTVLDMKFGGFEVCRGLTLRATVVVGETPDVSRDMKVSQRSPRQSMKVQIIGRNTSAAADNLIVPLIEIK